ncbi:MAG: VOC family protein [Gammaproteobacteria bacterium]
MLGDFLEISIATPDILASIDFYTRLGFKQASANDVWTHPYAVLTDGRVCLGLHQDTLPSPALAFVQPDLRRQLPEFEALGVQFEFRKLGEDQFNAAGFYAPDHQMITLVEARTFSPVTAQVSDSLCGYFEEYRLPASELQTSRCFWEQLGLISTEPADTQKHVVRLATGGLNLGLWDTNERAQPQLVFLHARPEDTARQLEQRGIVVQHTKSNELLLTAPEGTQLLIVKDDS